MRTQQTLGTIVKKPRLTDNLLKRPPFRFLHDVRPDGALPICHNV